MTNAYRDENHVPTKIAVLDTDGQTIMRLKASPIGAMKYNDGVTGTPHGPVNAKKDENGVSCMQAVSSVDGQTPVSLYINSNGELLIDSN